MELNSIETNVPNVKILMCPNVVKSNIRNMKKILFTTILFLVVITLFAQKKRANEVYDRLGYKASIPLFEERNQLSTDDLIKIANSYRLNHDVVSAELWYSQVVQESTEPIHILHYAQALHSNCLLYTSPSPRDRTRSRMPSSA